MSLDIDKAIRIWISDEGYRKINSFLIGASSNTDYIYYRKDNETINYEDNTYKTIDVINTIKENMRTSSETKTYYRGGSPNSKKSFIKKSFISLSTNEEQAKQFVDGDCCLFKVTVEPSVKRYNTGVEYEVLIEDGIYWEYIGKEGNYYLVNISKTPKHQELPVIETSVIKENLTGEELNSLLQDYEDECSILDEEPSPKGFIDYIIQTTPNKNIISIEKANEIMKGGKKIKKKLTKKIMKSRKLKIRKIKSRKTKSRKMKTIRIKSG